MTSEHSRQGKKRRWRRRKEARPGEILDAALDLFVERGFSATRLDDISRRAGIAKGTLYLYYESKEAIFRAVVTEVLLPIVERLEGQAIRFEGSTPDLLRELMRGFWTSVANSRLSGIPKLMVSEAGNFPEFAKFFVNQVVRRARRIFIRVLKEGIAKGELRDCDTHLAARALVAPMVFAAVLQRSLAPYDEPYDVEQYLEFHVDTFINGLAVKRKTR